MPQQRTDTPVSAAARRCVIYCRKSSSEGLDRNYTSIDAQRDTCLRFIESHAGDGWQYTGQVFEDGGFSGGTTDRPAFQRMMRDVRNGEIDIIVIYKLDRINRNKRDFWNIEHELRQHGVEIACATQRIYDKKSGKTRIHIGPPKTATSKRTIPLPSMLATPLAKFLTENPDHYFLTGKGKPTEPRTYRQFFARFLKKHGLAKMRFHEVRHTFAVRAMEIPEFDIKSLSKILGHKNVSFTLNVYGRANLQQKTRCMNLLNELL